MMLLCYLNILSDLEQITDYRPYNMHWQCDKQITDHTICTGNVTNRLQTIQYALAM